MWAWCFASSRSGGNSLWDGILSLPRELSLPADGILRIRPIKELEQLRYSPVTEQSFVVKSGTPHRLERISGDTIEIKINIQQSEAQRYGVRLFADKENGKGLDLIVEPAKKTIQLGSTTAPFELKSGEDIQLRIFVDRRTVEIFANDRQSIVKQHDYEPGDTGISLFCDGGDMEVKEIHSWKMAATIPW
jgi:beta-fructofuranosidase